MEDQEEKPQTENTVFDLNLEEDGSFRHIHSKTCYVLFDEDSSGLAKIIRALIPYRKVVADVHGFNHILEALQETRFELL